jgi:tetratricopeptide (TPR) repeat protein
LLRVTDARKASQLVTDGRYLEAQSVYKRMLERSPDDADVHYNMAVLCDEMLHEKVKAAAHYREYLRLRPAASDAMRVRTWLAALEAALPPAGR